MVQEKIALSQKNKELIAAREAEEKAKNEALAQLEKETKVHAELETKLQAERQALATLKEEKSALVQEIKTLAQEKISAAAAYDAQTKTKNEALDDLSKAHVRAKMGEEESTLMLARLHKMQEDAERYDVRLKDLQAKSEQEKAKLIEARAQLQEKLNEASKSRADAVQEKNALGQAQKEALAARDAELKAKTEALAELSKAQARAKMAEEESALMLAQLHKLQEEAERHALRLTELQAKSEQEKTKLIEARDAQIKARAETQEKLNEAGKSRAAIVQEKMALSQEKKEAIAARDAEAKAKAQALVQLEKESKLRADLQVKLQADNELRATLKQEKTLLAQENATLVQEKTKVIAARDAELRAKTEAIANLSKAQARGKMAEEESAQMLAQLHKLQEDAERYDLRIKDLQANLNLATARFRRVTSRQPDGIDWETVQTQPVMVEGRPALQCRATNVAVMGKEWKSLEFVALIQEGTLAFTFAPTAGSVGPAPLTRLPRSLGSLSEFTARAGRESIGQPSAELLKDISTSDWDLLRGLPRMLSLGLQYVRGAWPVGMPGPDAWEVAAKATLPALLRLPLALRYDVLKLQSASALPTNEYLRLRLDPLSLGKKRIAGFEFRFACNLGQGGQFGSNARLEFFKGSGTPTFEQWAPNALEGADERLDLVFVFPTSMNLKDWSALSVNDRSLVLLLADQLPTMLSELAASSVQIARPMADWVALAEKLRSFVRARLDVTGVQKQPDTLVDAVPGSVPQPGSAVPVKRRTASPSSVVSEIKKPGATSKPPVAVKKAILLSQSTRSTARAEPVRARKK